MQDEIGTAATRASQRSGSGGVAVVATGLAVVLLGGVLSAGLMPEPREDVLTVAQAAQTTAATGSARVTIRTVLGGSPPETFEMSGPVDFARNRYSLTGTFGGGSFEMRGIGREQWTKQDALGGVAGKPWVHMTLPESGEQPGFVSGAEPSRMLELLTREGRQVSRRTVGDREVLVIQVPLNEMLEPEAASRPGPDVEVTVEVDQQDRVRRVAFDPAGAGLESGATTLSYDDFGIEVDVRPPPADQVADMSDLMGHIGGTGRGSKEMCAMFDGEKLPPDVPKEKRAFMEQMLAEAKQACLDSAD